MTAQKKKGNKQLEERENVGDQLMIGLSFASDWLCEWREFSGPITVQGKAKTKQALWNAGKRESSSYLFSIGAYEVLKFLDQSQSGVRQTKCYAR